MDWFFNTFHFDNIYGITQFVMFIGLVLFAILFIGISYWFEFISYYKKKHGFNSDDKVLTDVVENKLTQTCKIQDVDTQKFLKKCLKIALDD